MQLKKHFRQTFFLLGLITPFFAYSDDISCKEKPGIIILLNGPSASGKSSIQKELQKQFPQTLLKAGIDSFFDALLPEPDLTEFSKKGELAQYTPDGTLIRRITKEIDSEGNQVIPLEIGPAGEKVIQGMHAAIRGYADRGNNIAVDYILYKASWRQDLISAFKGSTVYLIGIQAPISVIEDREMKRATSPKGHARSHYSTVHEGLIYDLTLDVARLTPQESARQIIECIKTNPYPTKFLEMCNMSEHAQREKS